MNILLLKAWLARNGPALIGAKLMRAGQLDERSLLLRFESDQGLRQLLISVLEEYPVIALIKEGDGLEQIAGESEGNFVKALNFHLQDYRLVAIRQEGFDRSIELTFRHKDKYGQETLKTLRPELAGRSANAFLLSERGMLISIMKRVRRDRERVREIQTGKPLPPPPPVGKYLAAEGGVEQLASEFARLAEAEPRLKEDLLKVFFTNRVAGGDQRSWPGIEPLIPVEYDLGLLADFIERMQEGEFNAEIFGLSAERDENRVALDEWLQARRRRGSPRQQTDPRRQRINNSIDQLIIERRNALRADEVEQLALDMLSVAIEIDQSGKGTSWLLSWAEQHSEWAEQVSIRHSVYENANSLVHYAQRLRRGLTKLDERIELAQQQLSALDRPGAAPQRTSPTPAVSAARVAADLEKLEKNGVKLRRFRSSDGYAILCGLNDRSNDGLVRMYGSARHLWLHVRDHSGSHVVVLEGGGELPSATLEEAAVIAAYHSQARGEPDVEVSYLPMNQLRRPRNAKPGQVLKLSEKVITVRPQRYEELRSSLAWRSDSEAGS